MAENVRNGSEREQAIFMIIVADLRRNMQRGREVDRERKRERETGAESHQNKQNGLHNAQN